MKRSRLKDIADATGYSANTVSLALRGSSRISAEARDVIHRAARELDYLPNLVAQALVSRQTKTIGLVLTDIMNPTLTLVARSIEQELSTRGYSMMLAVSDNVHDKELRAIEVLRSRQVDGLLIYPTHHGQLEHIESLRQSGHPALVLTTVPFAGVDVVAIDDRMGAYKAVRHLLSRGHRRIAILDAAVPLGNREKLDGTRHAINEAGLAADALVTVDPGGHSATDGHRAVQDVATLKDRPTAVFATNDSLGIGAMRWCLENGLSVPGDMALVGYDNT